MAEISAQAVKALREKTGVGIMECRAALIEAGGDEEKAIEILRKRGLAAAKRKEGRATAEGIIGAYVHHGSKIGVLVEVNCETDFVARNPEFQQFVKDLAMHICAAEPRYIRKEDVPEDVLAKEREIAREQALADPKMEGKPERVLEQIVEGRLAKFYAETVLLEQPFIKDPSRTIYQLLAELIAKFGENIRIRRFTRYKLGEDSTLSAATG
ncbi:MAG: translation elongation factor Ts [Blastocatellia bacterium]|nr:translation elongation factor Ts [Blastocatellia bacterium]MCS7158562.1 translation elongation factor Ts [Blastocatellia bacterium]MDW8169313.1 translation elongation factor Ts [Acidobacteriota bacterium]MDW8257758.1 translation elongation factor Ts [Acidobacteriota bacterium]